MSTQSFEPLQINSPIESSSYTNSSSLTGDHHNGQSGLIKNVDNDQQQQQTTSSTSTVIDSTIDYNCGWSNIRPKFLQRYMNAKWALFWLCWAGGIQGKIHISDDIKILINKDKLNKRMT